MVSTIKMSQFESANYNTSTNAIAGISSLSGGMNIQSPFVSSWSTVTRPSSPYPGLNGYNTTTNMPEYWNNSAWVSVNGSGGGTVSSGLQNQLGYYSSNGTTIVGLSTADYGVLVTSSGGVPSIVNGQIPGAISNSNANSGNIGEYIESIITTGSPFSISSGIY